ncbi:kinase-like domain-containing protein, partial [Mycena amicta]
NNRVVHGDLKGANILVSPSRRACIADFGFSSITDSASFRLTNSTRRGGTSRYEAPELLSLENSDPNDFRSDVYAFACVCYEIYAKKPPFFEDRNEYVVANKVLRGDRPSRLPIIPDGLWKLTEACWCQNPEDRPIMSQIVEELIGPTIGATQIEKPADCDQTSSSRFRRSVKVIRELKSTLVSSAV